MSWLDRFIFGIRNVYSAGNAMATRQGIDFFGASVTDDSANDRTVVTIPGVYGTFPNSNEETGQNTSAAGTIFSAPFLFSGVTACAFLFEARVLATDISNGDSAVWIVEHAAEKTFGSPAFTAVGSSTARLTRLSSGAGAAATPVISFSSANVLVTATNWAAHDIRWRVAMRYTAGGG